MQTAAAAMVQRFMRCGVAGLAVALLLAALALAPPVATVRAAGTTYTVTSTADNVNDATCGATCTLREAVNASNANDPGAGNANTIIFAATANGTTILLVTSGGALAPTHNVMIDATVGAHTVTISGNNMVGLFAVNSGVTLGLAGVTLTGGNAGSGGAINNTVGGTVTITGSTFSANTAGVGSGGAIANGGTVTVTNSTFSTNTANVFGGAIFNNSGTLTITGSTFSANTAGVGGAITNGGTVTLTLSVVAGNMASNTGPDITGNVDTDGGGNVIGNTTGATGLTAAGDKLNMPALLGALASNGGPVQTFALQLGSPAIDIAACPAGLTTDARGLPRPQGANCDAGSYELAASPQTLTVTRAADDVNDANCTVASCTLRQAVNLSNLTAGTGTNTITFSTTFSTAQTITLLAATGGTLTITHNVTIDATVGGRTVTVSGNNAVQLFVVNSGITLGLTGLTLRGGIANDGGAILNPVGGTVNITGSTFTGNTESGGGGAGGAIDNGGTMTIMGSTFTNNSASGGAGGAVGNGGTMTIMGSTFTGNTESGAGGAIYNDGMLTVTGSTLSGNTASSIGGAIYNNGGTVNITNGTLSGNTAFGGVGGIGGAIFNNSGATATITGSTLSGNSAPNGVGGAIYNGGTVTITITVVAGNTAGGGSSDINGPVTTDGGGNVVGNTSGSSGLNAMSDKLNVAPLLGLLANYGGTVQTFALLPGSPAIDILTCPMGLTTDARGVSRPQPAGGKCDAGAYEARAFTVGTITGNGQSAPITTAFATPVGLTVAGTMGDPVAGGQITFTITPGGGASATFGTLAGCTVTGGTVAVCTIPAGGVTASPAFTANGTAGSFTIVATATGVPATTFTETNIPGPAAIFSVTGCPSPIVSGTPCSVTVTAKDASGNTATGYTGTVAITSSDPRAVLPADASLTSGVGTFAVTLRTPGSQSITATDTMTSTITGSQTGITVTGTAPTATNDSYAVTTGLTLTVPAATGVLANDTKGTPQATITASTQPAHGTLAFTAADGSFVYTPTAGYVGNDAFTYTLTNSVGTSTGTVSLTVNAATVTSLTTTAPTGTGSGNTGTASSPVLLLGGKLTLATTATYNNGTTGPAAPLMYTSSNPGVATVDPTTGLVTALTPGTTTITVTGPNGSRTTITVTVTGAAGTGLMPLPQPMAHPGAAAVGAGTATPLPQPARR